LGLLDCVKSLLLDPRPDEQVVVEQRVVAVAAVERQVRTEARSGVTALNGLATRVCAGTSCWYLACTTRDGAAWGEAGRTKAPRAPERPICA
jgi:hypothetical protein